MKYKVASLDLTESEQVKKLEEQLGLVLVAYEQATEATDLNKVEQGGS